MKGGQQAVAVGKIDQHLIAGLRHRRVVPEKMPYGLQVAANPWKSLAAEGRENGAGIIANESQPPLRQ